MKLSKNGFLGIQPIEEREHLEPRVRAGESAFAFTMGQPTAYKYMLQKTKGGKTPSNTITTTECESP